MSQLDKTNVELCEKLRDMELKIVKIHDFRHDGLTVELQNMRADLTFLTINPRDITKWFGVTKNGYSVEYRLAPGVIIYGEIDEIRRKIINPKFEK